MLLKSINRSRFSPNYFHHPHLYNPLFHKRRHFHLLFDIYIIPFIHLCFFFVWVPAFFSLLFRQTRKVQSISDSFSRLPNYLTNKSLPATTVARLPVICSGVKTRPDILFLFFFSLHLSRWQVVQTLKTFDSSQFSVSKYSTHGFPIANTTQRRTSQQVSNWCLFVCFGVFYETESDTHPLKNYLNTLSTVFFLSSSLSAYMRACVHVSV